MGVAAWENLGVCILMVCVPFYMQFLHQQQKYKSTRVHFPILSQKKWELSIHQQRVSFILLNNCLMTLRMDLGQNPRTSPTRQLKDYREY